MRTQLRIVAGSLRGRRLSCHLGPHLRPMPDMVRQAMFSILGDAIPGRPFYDLFAGSGAVGLEALSRGAEPVYFVERDPRTAGQIAVHLRAFGVEERAHVQRSDVYRWVERWQPPAEAVTIFLGPPYRDFEERLDALVRVLADLQLKAAKGSVLVLQADHDAPRRESLPDAAHWEERVYGRNRLLFWVKETMATQP